MTNIRILAAFAASAVFAAAAIAQPAANISGTWNASFDSEVGKQTYAYTFKIDGGTLTGHSKSNLGESDLKGSVDKDKVSFVENLDYQGQMLAITYTGQIVSADEIKFKRDVGGQGRRDLHRHAPEIACVRRSRPRRAGSPRSCRRARAPAPRPRRSR